MSNYYCLVTGLPELSIDDGKLNFSMAEFREQVYPQLTNADRKVMDLFFLQYDNEALLALLKDKEAAIEPRGNYSKEELLELLEAVKEGEPRNAHYPAYLYDFLEAYQQGTAGEEASEDTLLVDQLSTRYYKEATQCKNRFVRSWFEFNLNINNLLTALTARKYKLDLASLIVGDNEVAEALKSSSARDFGLGAGLLEEYETVARIAESSDLLEKEKKIDRVKWEWLENNAFFYDFSVERLFVFLQQLALVERWTTLDKEQGAAILRGLIASLKEEVSVPDEFRQ
jgi:hypothetical protein